MTSAAVGDAEDRSSWPVVPGDQLHEVLGRGGFATVAETVALGVRTRTIAVTGDAVRG